jgi:hypothetical protein
MAIHQGILTPSANQIKVVLFSNTNQFTKDVQGKDGWRIELSLSDEQVQISHLRKEVSMIPGDNGYSFEWQLLIFLSLNFQSIDNIKLASTNLQMGANCNPILKQKIQDCLDQFKS